MGRVRPRSWFSSATPRPSPTAGLARSPALAAPWIEEGSDARAGEPRGTQGLAANTAGTRATKRGRIKLGKGHASQARIKRCGATTHSSSCLALHQVGLLRTLASLLAARPFDARHFLARFRRLSLACECLHQVSTAIPSKELVRQLGSRNSRKHRAIWGEKL